MVDADLAAELCAMLDTDQDAAHATVGPDGCYRPDDHPSWEHERRVRHGNTNRLKQIIAVQGWPRLSEVGEQAALAAWLIAQHSDHDRAFQREALGLMERLLPAGEVRPIDHAYLVDPVARAEGRPQEYGTQFEGTADGGWAGAPIRDAAHVDERRAAVGTTPLADYVAGASSFARPASA